MPPVVIMRGGFEYGYGSNGMYVAVTTAVGAAASVIYSTPDAARSGKSGMQVTVTAKGPYQGAVLLQASAARRMHSAAQHTAGHPEAMFGAALLMTSSVREPTPPGHCARLV